MSVRFAMSESDGDASWRDHQPTDPEDKLASAMESLLLSERLVVLAGLGTSLCVMAPNGERAAPSMTDLWDAVQADQPDEMAAALDQVGMDPDLKDIEFFLSRCQAFSALNPEPSLAAFVHKAEVTIANACNFVSSVDQVPVHATFLRKLARRSAGADRFRLFTTNYDLAFEHGANASGLIALDGFSQTVPGYFDPVQFEHDIIRRRTATGSDVDYVPGVHYLYKLHGSIDWRKTQSGVTKAHIEPASFRHTLGGEAVDAPCLVFPRNNKFQQSYEPPFFDLLAAFQAILRSENVGLLIIGFGFADAHIVRPILHALRVSPSLQAMIVDPTLEGSPPTAVEPIVRLLEAGDPRITLVSAKFEELVPVLPNLQPDTQREIHARRVETAGLA